MPGALPLMVLQKRLNSLLDRLLLDQTTVALDIVLPAANPGDVFDIQDHGNGRYTLVRLARPEPKARLTRIQCPKAIAAAPLHPKMDWARLRGLTRKL
jgi:hypothetical protein